MEESVFITPEQLEKLHDLGRETIILVATVQLMVYVTMSQQAFAVCQCTQQRR